MTSLKVFGGALALLVVFMLADPSQQAVVSYTVGDFSSSLMPDGKCGIITNWRNRTNFPNHFYSFTEDCASSSQTICEMKVPLSGSCPLNFNDLLYDGSCYKMKVGWRKHDYSNGLCRHLNPDGRLLCISSQAEFDAVGIWIAKSGKTTCGLTAEFTQGNTEPPAPAK
ncbi:unnamed protein product [Owenia fusiformis]|uniref:Uncharacterized protein n=1 Tax=Owenia fusiformis TaxID=6347 RepID=A0A8J1TG70_OWEFU|nr:unnamed protein product [Owenia fusiformis]